MADEKSILVATPQPAQGYAQVAFRPDEFDNAVWGHAYNAIFERAIRCPCSTGDHPLPNCENCLGTGYFYINPYKSQALLIGLNATNQYKSWSMELVGTVSVTVRDRDKEHLGYFDRITLSDQFAQYSENLEIRTAQDGTMFIFTMYAVQEILGIWSFQGATQPLKVLPKGSYSVSDTNPYVIIIDPDQIGVNNTISIAYKHKVEYHVLDFPHEIRASMRRDKSGRYEVIQLPINAIARRSHLIVANRPNFDGTGINSNPNVTY